MQNQKIENTYKCLKNKEIPPFALELNPSKRCNLSCSFCYTEGKGNNELPFKVYKRVLKEAKSLGVSEVRIVGKREPLIREDITKLIKYIKKLGFYGFMCTNGMLLEKKVIKKLIKYRWDRIEIGLHGSTSKLHDQLVNKNGAFNKILKNIELFNYYKRDNDKPKLGISTVLTNLNYKDIPSLIRLAKNLKMNDLILMPIIPNKRNKSLKLNYKQIKEFDGELKKINSLIKEYNLESNSRYMKTEYLKNVDNIQKSILSNSNYNNKILGVPCYFPWNYVSIDSNGYVGHCSFYKGSENILDKSLKDIWYGENFQNVRKKIMGRKLFTICRNCCPPYLMDNEIIREGLNLEFYD